MQLPMASWYACSPTGWLLVQQVSHAADVVSTMQARSEPAPASPLGEPVPVPAPDALAPLPPLWAPRPPDIAIAPEPLPEIAPEPLPEEDPVPAPEPFPLPLAVVPAPLPLTGGGLPPSCAIEQPTPEAAHPRNAIRTVHKKAIRLMVLP